MGQLVYILGRSGSGKSYSMRNFPKEKYAVINVQGKILPFKGAGQVEMTATDKSDMIVKALEIYAKSYKSIVIDDYQYTMANEFMRRSDERGYDKFTEIGRHAWDIANAVNELPNDVIVYIMCHTDRDEEGNEKIKTIGKLLDEKICLEGMSTIVLKTNVSDGTYTFLTQNNGKDTVKSPAGMFPTYAIDNDLYYVDQKIRNYYELGEFITDEEAAEIDELAKNVDIEKPSAEKKRRGRSAATEEAKRTRRTREEVEADNKAKEEAYAKEYQQAIDGVAGDADSVPFDDKIHDAVSKVPEPELETLPRRTRKDRTAETPEPEAQVDETADATPTRRRRRV